MINVPLLIILPVIAVFVIAIAGRKKAWVADTVIMATLCSGLWLWAGIMRSLPKSGHAVYYVGGWPQLTGISLYVDGLTLFFLVMVQSLVLIAAMCQVNRTYSGGSRWKMYALWLCMVSGLEGVLVAGDIFTLFVFGEAAACAGYGLVAMEGEKKSLVRAFQYMLVGILSSALILFAIALCYVFVSTLSMPDIALQIAMRCAGLSLFDPVNSVVLFIALLLVVGICSKAASALWFYGVGKTTGTRNVVVGILMPLISGYVFLRIFYSVIAYGRQIVWVLATGGAFFIIGGVITAISRKDADRCALLHMLSELVFVAFGVSIGTPLGIAAGLVHLINISIAGLLVSLSRGMNRNIAEGASGCGGLFRLTTAAGFMSLSGIPPFAGFWSKIIIIFSAWQAGYREYAVLAFIIGFVGILSFMQKRVSMFYRPSGRQPFVPARTPAATRLAMVILGLLCLGANLLWIPGLRSAFIMPAVRTIIEGTGIVPEAGRVTP
ncbi:MAG: proton-conducting transporter membrane subunit [Candidatus Omnitrophica bacterium]|nr:proton-conducting transporter membrane subunit [Candidatus Omnitrophota bacterium]